MFCCLGVTQCNAGCEYRGGRYSSQHSSSLCTSHFILNIIFRKFMWYTIACMWLETTITNKNQSGNTILVILLQRMLRPRRKINKTQQLQLRTHNNTTLYRHNLDTVPPPPTKTTGLFLFSIQCARGCDQPVEIAHRIE